MEVLDRASAVSPDGRAVVFMLLIRGREVEGAITRDAPEEHFWLSRGADATCTLKTFENGRNRIVAVAQRKVLARGQTSGFRSPSTTSRSAKNCHWLSRCHLSLRAY